MVQVPGVSCAGQEQQYKGAGDLGHHGSALLLQGWMQEWAFFTRKVGVFKGGKNESEVGFMQCQAGFAACHFLAPPRSCMLSDNVYFIPSDQPQSPFEKPDLLFFSTFGSPLSPIGR
jgi:hypothetical protein